MNPFDWLIIHLTCGAPLGVLYFLQNRKKQIGFRLWIKTFFTFTFWLPFCLQLIMNKARKNSFDGKKIFSKTAKTETEIFLFRKQFESALGKSNLQIPIFEFREVFDRYVGLTIAKNCGGEKMSETTKELFRIGGNSNVGIGAICLNRRNLKRLTFHQTQARLDFFHIINRLATDTSDKVDFTDSTAEFFRFLNDAKAQFAIDEISIGSLQNEKVFAANRSENYLWNTEIRQPPTAKSVIP